MLTPLILLRPLLSPADSAPESERPIYHILIFTSIGVAALSVLVLTTMKNYSPFTWWQIKRWDSNAYIVGLLLLIAGILVSNLFTAGSSGWTYTNLVFIAVAVIYVVLKSGNIIVAIILHALNNFSATGGLPATWSLDRTSTVLSAPFGEELAKLSFAIGMVLILQNQRAMRQPVKIHIAAYSTASAIWIFSHCMVYPIPFIPCW